MKTTNFLFVILLSLLGLTSCTKEDLTTPCPTNPLDPSTDLCGVWDIVAQFEYDSFQPVQNYTWTIERTDSNYIEQKQNGISLSRGTFYIGQDSIGIKLETSNIGTWTLDTVGSLDTLLLTQRVTNSTPWIIKAVKQL